MRKKNNPQINIFFCPSWGQITEIINLTKRFKGNFIFIVEKKSLYVFFKKYYLRSKIILLKSPKTLFTINLIKFINNFYANYLEKKKIEFILKKYSTAKVYCAVGFNLIQMAYAAKILSFKNEIFLYSNNVKIKNFYKKKISLKTIFYYIYIKILYGISCYFVVDHHNNYFTVYPNKYYNFISAKKIKNKIDFLIIKKFIKNKINLSNKIKILLLSSFDAKSENLLDINKFKIWINELTKIVDPKKIIFKRKYINEKKYFSEKLFSEAPPYIPASLLLYKVEIVIGYSSSTLFEAANAGVKAISLLDLLKKKELNLNKTYYKKYLNNNLTGNKRILFPRTINDFKKLI
jgi:hypothetical protein